MDNPKTIAQQLLHIVGFLMVCTGIYYQHKGDLQKATFYMAYAATAYSV